MSITTQSQLSSYDILIEEGTDFYLNMALTEDDGTSPISIVSAEFRYDVGSGTVTVPCTTSTNAISLHIPDTQVFSGTYGEYQLDVTLTTGDVQRVLRGSLSVEDKI